MSKAFLYGIVAVGVGISASATFFYPVVSNINSLFNGKSESFLGAKEGEKNASEVQSSNEVVKKVSHIENPSVQLYDDSSDKKIKVNPMKTEMLQGEIPTTKTF